ncbi:transporter substrate-binding domain-containing protein [Anaeromyxobacter sp. PSR-1]|uniref:transporter substrate-binding domain-containing protein n=1 Tax=Anaeromyxobacter sp. PSR-1 TaxID=1300915 RepID=UPI0005E665EC|nr:transporter substrate-binding domain-containing protein [Anaeromyxobacter sp. PSR-1]GAO02489.1 putative sensor protein [Anaeromyxobacter sp. PSR-1]
MGRIHACLLVAALLAAAPVARAVPPAPQPRRVVVGADRDYPPYEFLDEQGEPAGFNVDLTRAIAEVMGLTVEFRFGDWAGIRAGLADGSIDVLQGISWSEERARRLDFAAPHAIVHHAIFVRKDGPRPASLDALAGREVVVFGGGIMDEEITRAGKAARIIRTQTPADALRLLASGQHDCVVLALLPGIYLQRQLGLTNIEPVGEPVRAERYGYAVRKGDRELLARFDEGLAILKQTGRYDAIHARWLGPLEPRPIGWQAVARYAALGALPILVLLGASIAWSRSLRRLVAQRTASLEREVAERERAVAALREHQHQLVQAQKAAAMGVLVSGVAHEINNPAGYILLNVPTLKAAFADAQEVLDARARERELKLAGIPYARMRDEIPQMLDEIAEGGRRIKRIVDDLKDFARRDDAPRLEPMDLGASARAAVRLLEAPIRAATSRFELALAPDLPRVRGNPHRLEQVIVNLLLNACQALPDRDRGLRLSIRHDPAAGEVVLEVRDEGVGIPPEHLARLTDPFFTTKRETGGTGLGLSVSAGIVKEHGGRLEFGSQPGVGTTAALVLPALHEEAAA